MREVLFENSLFLCMYRPFFVNMHTYNGNIEQFLSVSID